MVTHNTYLLCVLDKLHFCMNINQLGEPCVNHIWRTMCDKLTPSEQYKEEANHTSILGEPCVIGSHLAALVEFKFESFSLEICHFNRQGVNFRAFWVYTKGGWEYFLILSHIVYSKNYNKTAVEAFKVILPYHRS